MIVSWRFSVSCAYPWIWKFSLSWLSVSCASTAIEMFSDLKRAIAGSKGVLRLFFELNLDCYWRVKTLSDEIGGKLVANFAINDNRGFLWVHCCGFESFPDVIRRFCVQFDRCSPFYHQLTPLLFTIVEVVRAYDWNVFRAQRSQGGSIPFSTQSGPFPYNLIRFRSKSSEGRCDFSNEW